MAASRSGDFLRGDHFEVVLAIFCSYDYGENSSETVEKIATVEKDYHKYSLYCTATIKKVGY